MVLETSTSLLQRMETIYVYMCGYGCEREKGERVKNHRSERFVRVGVRVKVFRG